MDLRSRPSRPYESVSGDQLLITAKEQPRPLARDMLLTKPLPRENLPKHYPTSGSGRAEARLAFAGQRSTEVINARVTRLLADSSLTGIRAVAPLAPRRLRLGVTRW
jgi:hypothetical protein